MDSRLDVEQVLGLDIGDAHVIRNGTFPNLIIVLRNLTTQLAVVLWKRYDQS
jgi:carbonic anhydrase